MIGAIYSEQPRILQIRMILFQNPVQPLLVFFGYGKIVLHEFTVGHNGDGKKLLPHFNACVSCTGGHFLRVGENREIAVGFQDGVLHRSQIQYIFFPQMPGELVQGDPGPAEIVLQNMSVIDENHRISAEKPP